MSKKLLRSLSAAAAALVMMVTVPVLNLDVSAEDDGYTALDGGKTYFVKALVLDKGASVPDVSFSYSIDNDITEIPAGTTTDGKITLQVRKGVVVTDTDEKITAPTVSTSVFSPTSTTFPQLQTAENLSASNVKHNDTEKTVVPDIENLAGYTIDFDKQIYARDEVKVDLSGITFNEPGIYRYKITENSTPAVSGIVYDATRASVSAAATAGDRIRYLDVYVYHNEADTTDKTLKIAGYVLHKDSDAPSYTLTTTGEGDSAVTALTPTEPSTKSSGYVNVYSSHDLTISKNVAGNQGSRDEYFRFDVRISGAASGTKYTVDLTDAEAETKTNGLDSNTHENVDEFTVPADATEVTQSFYLKHGQSITIHGLATGTVYEITEKSATDTASTNVLNDEGYVTGAKQYTDNAYSIEDKTDDTANYSYTGTTRVLGSLTAGIDADKYILYTNTRQGVIPTGILLTFTPYIVIGAVVIAGIILLVLRRHKKSE